MTFGDLIDRERRETHIRWNHYLTVSVIFRRCIGRTERPGGGNSLCRR